MEMDHLTENDFSANGNGFIGQKMNLMTMTNWIYWQWKWIHWLENAFWKWQWESRNGKKSFWR